MVILFLKKYCFVKTLITWNTQNQYYQMFYNKLNFYNNTTVISRQPHAKRI